jgi:hypothetical protein
LFEGLEDALQLALAQPRPVVDDAQNDLAVELVARQLDRSVRRELESVVDQVDENVLDLDAVDLDRVETRRERDLDALGARSEFAQRLPDERLERPELRLRLRRPELEA